MFLDSLQIPLRPYIDDWDKEAGAAETETDADEGESSKALGETVYVREDEGVTIEKGEENDVDDGQVERHKHDNGLASSEHERTIESVPETTVKCFFTDLNFGFVAVVASEIPQMVGLPFQQDWRISFRLEKNHKRKHYPRNDESDPLGPSPADSGALSNEAANDRTEDWAHKGGSGEDWERVNPLHRTPKIRDGPTSASKRSRSEEASEEAECELSANIRGKPGCHNENHIYGKSSYVDWISTDGLRNRSSEEASSTETD